MEMRDRIVNVALLVTAALAWVLVGMLVTSRDPLVDPAAGFVGAVLIGTAIGLSVAPLFWLAAFARHRRIAYRGDWVRAGRRGGWVAVVVALFVALRLGGALQLPIALFVLTMVALAEATLSAQS